MAQHPIEAHGTFRSSQGTWMIELDRNAPSIATPSTNASDAHASHTNASHTNASSELSNMQGASANDSFAASLTDGTPVRLLFWPESSSGELTELETIAKIQQLDLRIVAHGLEAEGALSEGREEFIRRLSSIEQ